MIFEALWESARYCEEEELLRAACDGAEDGSVVLGADLSAPGQVIDRLITARRVGQKIALYPVLDDPYEGALADFALHVAGVATFDQRRVLLRALADDQLRVNDVRLADVMPLGLEQAGGAAFACKLADVVLFATESERQRFQALLGREIVRFAFLDLPEPQARASGVISGPLCVYAPSTPRTRLRFIDLAFEGWKGTLDFIARGDNRAIPADAQAVICPEWWRPVRAARVAAQGFNVIAPRKGGADERGHALCYSECDGAAIRRALSTSILAPAPSATLRSRPENIVESIRRHTALPAAGPLVSVIVRTFDRPALLQRALESIASQTYFPIEAIVVNGGGVDVRDRFVGFADRLHIVYVESERRTRVSESANLAIKAVNGEFVAYLDDDDVLYPDHVARCVDVLTRTGCKLVYTNCTAEYAEIVGDEKRVLDVKMYLDRDFDRDSILVNNVATIHSIMHRADIFERFGTFDESLTVCEDWDMWTRVAQAEDFIHIDRVTCEYSWRWDAGRNSNTTLKLQEHFAEAHGRIYARYDKEVIDRPSLVAQQRAALQHLRDRTRMIAVQPERARELLFGR